MKMFPRFLLILSLLFALISSPATMAKRSVASGSGTVSVSGYYRSNGKYVQPYVRRAPGTSPESSSASIVVSDSGPLIAAVESSSSRERARSTKNESIPRGFSTAAVRARLLAKMPPLYGWPRSEFYQYRTPGVLRNAGGRIQRSETAKRAFMRKSGYPNGRPGFVVDHIIPLKRGGADDLSNMQWQTVEEAKAKDRWE